MDISEKKASEMSNEMIDKTSNSSLPPQPLPAGIGSKESNVQSKENLSSSPVAPLDAKDSFIRHKPLLELEERTYVPQEQAPGPQKQSFLSIALDKTTGFIGNAEVFVGTYVIRPVVIGAKYVADTAADVYKAVVAGLFKRTEETAQKIDDLKKQGKTDLAAEEAAKFMTTRTGKVVDKNIALKLFDEYKAESSMIREQYDKGIIDDKQALQKLEELAGRVGNDDNIGSQEQHDLSIDLQATFEHLARNASAANLAKNAAQIARTQNAIIKVAQKITDKALREDALAQINASNDQIAANIAEKLNSDKSGDSARVFIINIQELRDLFNESSELTDSVEKMLADNRAEQNRLDAEAADKKAQELASLKKEDENVDQRKIDAKKRDIKKMQKMLDQLMAANKDNPEIKKLEAEIIDQLSRKPQIPT